VIDIDAILSELDHPDSDGREIILTSAITIKVRPVRWMWQDRIALGTLALVGGREGIGKSTVCYEIAADLTRGRLPGQHHGTPTTVIVAATEDSREHTIVPRLMAAKADLTRVFFVDVRTSAGLDGQLTLPADLAQLRDRIGDVDAGMVLLDPLMSRLSASLDTHKDADVRRALEPLVALADTCQVALMASRAFAAVARSVLFVAVDPDNQQSRVVGVAKNNLGRVDLPSLMFTIDGVKVADTDEGPVWTSRIVWQGETPRTIYDVLESASQTSEAKSAVNDAAAWLEDYLTEHPVSASQAIKEAGMKEGHSDRTLKRAREKIGAGVINHGMPRRTYWSAFGMTPNEADAFLSQNGQSGHPVRPTPRGELNNGLTGLTGGESPVGPVGPAFETPRARGLTRPEP
jgi:hypothetical protein